MNSDHVPSGPDWLNVLVTATNVGVSPARDVRISAEAVLTNNPQYAFDSFRASLRCVGLAMSAKLTLYPNKHASDINSLHLSDARSFMKALSG